MRIPLVSAILALALGACSDDPKRPVGGTCGGDSECEAGLCLAGECLDPAADEDLDGLINALEGALGSNPFNRDTDYDAVSDGAELDDSAARDTDGDGVADILESRVEDRDADCLPDELDANDGEVATDLQPAAVILCGTTGVCLDFPGGIAVTCGDDKRPVCDYTGIATYESGEQTCDGLDNDCDGRTDEGFPDADGDLLADCADDDRDGDGAANSADNCPSDANASQADADADALGDACDAPVAPTLTGFAPASPVNVLEVTASGQGEALSTVSVYSDAKCQSRLGEGQVSADGRWTAAVTVSVGTNVFWLRALNGAGLASPCEASDLTLDVDQTPPGPVDILTFAAIEWTTREVRFEVIGRTEPGASVRLFSDASCTTPLGDSALAETGDFDIRLVIASNVGDVFARATDIAGNDSPCAKIGVAFGDIVVEVEGSLDGPRVEVPVQFHYPDGTPAGAVVYTDGDGRASTEGFAGYGVTVALDFRQGYYRFATVLGAEPGAVLPFVAPTYAFVEGLFFSFLVTFPTPPVGTQWLKVLAPCGAHYLNADLNAGEGRFGVDSTCFSGPVFDFALEAIDSAGQPLAYMVKTGLQTPVRGDNALAINLSGPWLDTGWFINEARLNNGPSGARASMTTQLSSRGDKLDSGDAHQVFMGANQRAEIVSKAPPIPAMTARWSVEVLHLAEMGSGRVGKLGASSSVPYALAFDVTRDFLPRIFSFRPRFEPAPVGAVPSVIPVAFDWTAEPGLARADAMRFEMYVGSNAGYLSWDFIGPGTERGLMAVPKLDGSFPGADVFKSAYYAYSDRLTFYDSPSARSFTEVLAVCPPGAECDQDKLGELDFSSCCDGGTDGGE